MTHVCTKRRTEARDMELILNFYKHVLQKKAKGTENILLQIVFCGMAFARENIQSMLHRYWNHK